MTSLFLFVWKIDNTESKAKFLEKKDVVVVQPQFNSTHERLIETELNYLLKLILQCRLVFWFICSLQNMFLFHIYGNSCKNTKE